MTIEELISELQILSDRWGSDCPVLSPESSENIYKPVEFAHLPLSKVFEEDVYCLMESGDPRDINCIVIS